MRRPFHPHTLALALLLTASPELQAQDTTIASLHLEAFPFGAQHVDDPLDLLVDATGHVWLLDRHRVHCLLEREVVAVAEVGGEGLVLGWAAGSANGLLVHTDNGDRLVPLDGGHFAPDDMLLPDREDPRLAHLPDGQRARLMHNGTLLIEGPADTLEVALRFAMHGNRFELRTDGPARLVFDPRNGLWVMGRNGLVLVGQSDQVFTLVDTPIELGKVAQVVEDPAIDRRFVFSRSTGLLVQELSSGRIVEHILQGPQGDRIGGTKWRRAHGDHLLHTDHCLYRYDPATDALVLVLDLREILPPDKAHLRINDFEAGADHRFAYLGTADNLLVIYEHATGRHAVKELLPPGSFSGINLIIETALMGNDQAVVMTEHAKVIVEGIDGPVQLASERWPKLQFGPNFRGAGARVIGDTLVVLAGIESGLFLYHIPKDSLYRPMGAHQHLLITDVFWDGSHHLFATCRTGLLVYDLRDNTAELVGGEHGLPLNNLFYRYISVSPDGELFLGLTDRYTRFRSERLVRDGPEGLFIEYLEVNGRRTLDPAYHALGDRLSLPHQSNSIGIRLGRALRATAPHTGIHVRLNDDPGSTVFHDDHDIIRFHALEPGSHRVQGAFLADGPYFDLLTLSIAPPFWNAWWFYAGLAAALILLTAALTTWRARVLREKALLRAEYDARVTELELSSLRARMHPHFIFNSLNSIKSFIAANEPRTATRYLNKFAQLVRAILNDSGRAQVELRSELKSLELYLELERMRFDGSFDIQLVVDPGIDPDEVLVPPLIMQPYAENAIWHGLMHKDADRQLYIQVERDADELHILVRDNGIGREAARARRAMSARRHRPLGMSITEEVIGRMRTDGRPGVEVRDLVDPDGAPAGTEVHIRLPYRTP